MTYKHEGLPFFNNPTSEPDTLTLLRYGLVEVWNKKDQLRSLFYGQIHFKGEAD